MKILVGFVAGFLLAAAMAVGTVQAFVIGMRAAESSCVCEDEKPSRPGFHPKDPMEAHR